MKRVGRRGRVLGVIRSEEELLGATAQRKLLEAAGIGAGILEDMSEEEKTGTLKAILASNPALLDNYKKQENETTSSSEEKETHLDQNPSDENFTKLCPENLRNEFQPHKKSSVHVENHVRQADEPSDQDRNRTQKEGDADKKINVRSLMKVTKSHLFEKAEKGKTKNISTTYSSSGLHCKALNRDKLSEENLTEKQVLDSGGRNIISSVDVSKVNKNLQSASKNDIYDMDYGKTEKISESLPDAGVMKETSVKNDRSKSKGVGTKWLKHRSAKQTRNVRDMKQQSDDRKKTALNIDFAAQNIGNRMNVLPHPKQQDYNEKGCEYANHAKTNSKLTLNKQPQAKQSTSKVDIPQSTSKADSPLSVHGDDSDTDAGETQAPEVMAEESSDSHLSNVEEMEQQPEELNYILKEKPCESFLCHRKDRLNTSQHLHDSLDNAKDMQMETECSSPEQQNAYLVSNSEEEDGKGEDDDDGETQAYDLPDNRLLVGSTETCRTPGHLRKKSNTPDPIPESQSPSHSPKSSDENEVELHAALNRTYVRQLKYGKSTLWPCFYAPDHIKDPACYTQVIKLMFNIYVRRLQRAQLRMTASPKAWGRPVRAGPHEDGCLMAKQASSDEDADEGREERRGRSLRSGRPVGSKDVLMRRTKNGTMSDFDEMDLENDSKRLTHGSIRPFLERSMNEDSRSVTARGRIRPYGLRRGNEKITAQNTMDEEDARELFGEEDSEDNDIKDFNNDSGSSDDWVPPRKQGRGMKTSHPIRGSNRGKRKGRIPKEGKPKESKSTLTWLSKKKKEPVELKSAGNILDSEEEEMMILGKRSKQDSRHRISWDDKSPNKGDSGKKVRQKDQEELNQRNTFDFDEEEKSFVDKNPRQEKNTEAKLGDKVVDKRRIGKTLRATGGLPEKKRYKWSDSDNEEQSLPYFAGHTEHKKQVDLDPTVKTTSALHTKQPSASSTTSRSEKRKEIEEDLDNVVTIDNDDTSNEQKDTEATKLDDLEDENSCDNVDNKAITSSSSTAKAAADSKSLPRNFSGITSSQSSESLLDAQGNLFSTQLLLSKRRTQVNNGKASSMKRPATGADETALEHQDNGRSAQQFSEKQNDPQFKGKQLCDKQVPQFTISSEEEGEFEAVKDTKKDTVQKKTLSKELERKRGGRSREKEVIVSSDAKSKLRRARDLDLERGNESPGKSSSSSDIETEPRSVKKNTDSKNLKRKRLSVSAIASDNAEGILEQNMRQVSTPKKRRLKIAGSDREKDVEDVIVDQKVMDVAGSVEKNRHQRKTVNVSVSLSGSEEESGSGSGLSAGLPETVPLNQKKMSREDAERTKDSSREAERTTDGSGEAGFSREKPKGTCPICGEMFLQSELEAHAATCGEEPISEREDDNPVRCIYCRKEFNPQLIRDHQARCSHQEDGPIKRLTRSYRN